MSAWTLAALAAACVRPGAIGAVSAIAVPAASGAAWLMARGPA